MYYCINDHTHSRIEELPASGHSLTKTNAVSATCEESGNIEYWTCTVCGKLFLDEYGITEITYEDTVISPTGHEWSEWITEKEATETETGIEYRVCAHDSEHIERREIPVLVHQHIMILTEAVSAICEESGNIEYWTCTGCGRLFLDENGETEINVEDTVLPAIGHEWGEWAVTTVPSCETNGEETRICKNDAAHTQTRIIASTGHIWDEGVVTKEPTCLEEGIRTYTCQNDPSHTRTEAIGKTGHTSSAAIRENEIPATCTAEGSYDEVIYCSVCHEELSRITKTTEKIPHSYGNWIVTIESNCIEEGSREKVCAVCGDKITESIPVSDHLWNEFYTTDRIPTCAEEGIESIHCLVCSAIKEGSERTVAKTEDHRYGDWITVREPSYTETGLKERNCEVCGKKEQAEIPMLEVVTITASDVSDIEVQTYTGNALTPAVTVAVNGTTLTEGTDYSVSYANNTNAGTASVTVTGIGDYTGTVTKEFTINPKSVTPDVTLSATSYTYDGKAKKPGVAVKDGSKTLTEGTDYNVTYASGRTNAGTYNVKVTLQGNYSGSKKVSFTINKTAQKVTATAAASVIYAGKATTITVSGNQGTVTYSSSDTSVATITKAGKVTGKKAGTVTISVVSAATDNYKKKTVTVTVKVIAMPAATSKAAAANKAGGINVAWKKVSGATGYKIYRNDKLAKTITDVNTLSWGDTKATANGTKYVYKIAAYTDAGISDNTASVTIYRLDRPAISSLTNSAAGKMTVKWGKNAKATGYQVQYSTSSTFDSYKTVTITSNATVSKVIASLTKGKTYYVRVRSYKKVSSVNYYSMWSTVKKLKITK